MVSGPFYVRRYQSPASVRLFFSAAVSATSLRLIDRLPFLFVMPGLRQRLVSGLRSLRERLRPSGTQAEYGRVYDRLSRAELRHEDPRPTESDVASLFGPPEARVDNFLGLYSAEGGHMALERYGFLQLLRDKGFENLLLSTDTSDSSRHTLRIHFDQRDLEHLLVEMVLGFKPLRLPDGTACRMLSVEWLLLQDPRKDFASDRAPLPDQRYPGLGLFRWQAELLRLMATRLDCDGLLNNPQQFHNGVLYGRAMSFVDPVDEGDVPSPRARPGRPTSARGQQRRRRGSCARGRWPHISMAGTPPGSPNQPVHAGVLRPRRLSLDGRSGT